MKPNAAKQEINENGILQIAFFADKHIFEGEWQTVATWKHPFKRYQLAGYDRTIKNVRGEIINFATWTLEDHFMMLGYKLK